MCPVVYLVSILAKRALVPLELKFQVVKSFHTGAVQVHLAL